MPKIQVKVVVMTEPDGRWVSSGWGGTDIDELVATCAECAEAEQQMFHVLTAEVDLPVPTEAREVPAAVGSIKPIF